MKEKENALQAVRLLMTKLGLTSKEVIDYLSSTSSAQTAKVGMYYYAKENIYSPKPIPGKTISGIIAYVDPSGHHGLVIGLREERLPWSKEQLWCDHLLPDDGLKNTQLIMLYAQKYKHNAQAAEWCHSYAYDGISAGNAFLPSSEQWLKIISNIADINLALGKIHKPLLDKFFYWTSSVAEITDYSNSRGHKEQRAETIGTTTLDTGLTEKNVKEYTRCVISF